LTEGETALWLCRICINRHACVECMLRARLGRCRHACAGSRQRARPVFTRTTTSRACSGTTTSSASTRAPGRRPRRSCRPGSPTRGRRSTSWRRRTPRTRLRGATAPVRAWAGPERVARRIAEQLARAWQQLRLRPGPGRSARCGRAQSPVERGGWWRGERWYAAADGVRAGEGRAMQHDDNIGEALCADEASMWKDEVIAQVRRGAGREGAVRRCGEEMWGAQTPRYKPQTRPLLPPLTRSPAAPPVQRLSECGPRALPPLPPLHLSRRSSWRGWRA